MRPRDWISATALTLAMGVAIFAVGGAPRWAQALVAGLVAVAGAAQLGAGRIPTRPSALIVVLALAAGLTIVQLVPIGEAAVRWFNPTGAALRADGTTLTGVTPSQTLTFDVPGSLASLAFFLTLLGGAVVALRIATTERETLRPARRGRCNLRFDSAGCGRPRVARRPHVLRGLPARARNSAIGRAAAQHEPARLPDGARLGRCG